jgi:glycosyltransferase involved in cell wall biosynthesis
MKVSGFTIIRNAITYDYPIVEAITSILPVCDEVIVALGNSDDATADLIKNISSPKIKIIHTIWDDSLREGGRVLAVETDKALAAIAQDSDWAFYIQGDEVIHEKYLPAIKEAMERWKDDNRVEGLLFNYQHFYGSYDYIGDSRRWYRREVRVIRNIPGMQSFRDAQGFRLNGKLLRVKPIDATMYHYGWVKPPDKQSAKQIVFNRYWHSDEWVDCNVPKSAAFNYSGIDSLAHFQDSHPQVMKRRIDACNWEFTFDPTQKKFSLLARFLHFVEKKTGYRIGEYKNFSLLRG